MQGYWKKDVTGAMILPERETPRLLARATFLAKALRFFVHDETQRVSALFLSDPLPLSRPSAPSRPLLFPAGPFVPLSVPQLRSLFVSPSRYSFVRFSLVHPPSSFSRRRYGRFDADERRYQDDDLRRDFFLPAPTIDPSTRNVATLISHLFASLTVSRNISTVNLDRSRSRFLKFRLLSFLKRCLIFRYIT